MARDASSMGRREVMGGLAKGLGVLRTFSRTNPHMTLSEIAARAGLPAATARRCLNTFEELGYVTRNGRQFTLRPKVLEIGAVYLDSIDVDTLMRNHLEEIARETNDSGAVAVLSGTEIVFIARTSVRIMARLEAHVGSHFPAYAAAMGRVLLGGLTPEGLATYFSKAKLERLTERTVTDRATLEQLIATARRDGYATADGELAPEVVSLAVPIYDGAGRVVAALNSSSHASQATGASLVATRLPLLQRTAASISAQLAAAPGLSLGAQL